MTIFLYHASDAQGKMSSGKREAADKAALSKDLGGQGLFLVSCQEESGAAGPVAPAAQAVPVLPRKVVGPGLKARAAEYYRLAIIFLLGLQRWSKLEDASGVLRQAGIAAGHPLDRFLFAFIGGMEKVFRVGYPANQSINDVARKHLCKKRDRAVLVTFSAGVMLLTFLITRISFSGLNPTHWQEAREARRFSEGMTRAQVEAELGHGFFRMGPQTTYLKSPGHAVQVTYDYTGGPQSPANIVVGHGVAMEVVVKAQPQGVEVANPTLPSNPVIPQPAMPATPVMPTNPVNVVPMPPPPMPTTSGSTNQ
jgi:hypothetical protein